MVVYNFKKVRVVPSGKDFVDIVLSRTQRKTATVVHPQYNIHRIRKFYMRKVKYTQATIHEKLGAVLEDFPRLEVCCQQIFHLTTTTGHSSFLCRLAQRSIR